MNLLPRNFDSIFGDFFPNTTSQSDPYFAQMIPRVDIEEQENRFVIKADLPGMTKEDIQVELHRGLLTIKAEHEEQSEEKKDGKVIRRERHSGSYIRSFDVGAGITENDISGEFTDGVLMLTVPKSHNAESFVKKVAIN